MDFLRVLFLPRSPWSQYLRARIIHWLHYYYICIFSHFLYFVSVLHSLLCRDTIKHCQISYFPPTTHNTQRVISSRLVISMGPSSCQIIYIIETYSIWYLFFNMARVKRVLISERDAPLNRLLLVFEAADGWNKALGLLLRILPLVELIRLEMMAVRMCEDTLVYFLSSFHLLHAPH